MSLQTNALHPNHVVPYPDFFTSLPAAVTRLFFTSIVLYNQNFAEMSFKFRNACLIYALDSNLGFDYMRVVSFIQLSTHIRLNCLIILLLSVSLSFLFVVVCGLLLDLYRYPLIIDQLDLFNFDDEWRL